MFGHDYSHFSIFSILGNYTLFLWGQDLFLIIRGDKARLGYRSGFRPSEDGIADLGMEKTSGHEKAPGGSQGLVGYCVGCCGDYRLELDFEASVCRRTIVGVILSTEVHAIGSFVSCTDVPAIGAILVLLVDGSASAEL